MHVSHHLRAIGGSAIAVGVVAGLVWLLDPIAPTLSLGVLFTLSVLAVAVVFGLGYAIATAFVSMLVFNFFFLAPVHTFRLADTGNWSAIAVYLVTAVVASELATRARARARVAEQREREAALLADAAGSLLQAVPVAEIRRRADEVLPTDDPVARHRFETALAALLELAEERERTADLERSDAIKTAVLQSVSHDFRTPLATISAALDGLESPELTLSDDARADLLSTMRLEVARLTRLVGNLLDHSRLQVGAAAPNPSLWPVAELLARSLAELPGLDRIDVHAPDDLPPARIDDVQIQRALVNLIENALKFSTGRVDISAHADGATVVIEVRDEGGAGAPGAGIGLAIARGFAAVNGGSVELEPRAAGGTTARLVVPAEPAVASTI